MNLTSKSVVLATRDTVFSIKSLDLCRNELEGGGFDIIRLSNITAILVYFGEQSFCSTFFSLRHLGSI